MPTFGLVLQLTRAEFEETRPFKALHVRVRDQIVADGFAAPLDWNVGVCKLFRRVSYGDSCI